jgi:hypothetical protein
VGMSTWSPCGSNGYAEGSHYVNGRTKGALTAEKGSRNIERFNMLYVEVSSNIDMKAKFPVVSLLP